MNDHEKRKALGKAMKVAGMENLGYLPMCDDVQCRACKKHRSEKAPWNVKGFENKQQ